MKAAVLRKANAPVVIEDLQPPLPAWGQVLINVRASGLCGTDVHVWKGVMPVPLPIVLGHEAVGEIAQLGPGVTTLKVGDRVGVSWVQSGCGRCRHCQRAQERYCANGRSWISNGGGMAEAFIAEASGCTLLPDSVSWENAAPMFCAGYTVMSGYRNATPRPGERVAVIGIGGLGHLALQVARALGHEVIAVTSSESKRAEAIELGASDVLVVKQHAGKELAAMGGVDIVLSTSNSMKQNSEVIFGLLPEGRLVTMAAGAGQIEVDPNFALMKQIRVQGSMQNQRQDLVDVLELVAAGRVKPKLELYPLADVAKAMTRLVEGKVRYRAVIQPEA